MGKRVIITGATGLIGLRISRELIERGDDVIIFTRNPVRAEKKLPGASAYIQWHYNEISDKCKESLNNADAVIHLAGESIMGRRWNNEHKKKVYDSRIISTKNIVNAIKGNENKPSAFICASAVGYYDNDIDKEFDESGEHGSGFIPKVVYDWEQETAKIESLGVRGVSIRIGIVLDKSEGALAKMLLPYKFFIGGPLGNGKQWIPWIHVADISNLFIYALDNNLAGVYNGVSSNVRMNEFASTLGEVMNRPSFFRVPSFILELMLGEASATILKGSRVIPAKTEAAGYKFRFSNFEEALKDLFSL